MVTIISLRHRKRAGPHADFFNAIDAFPGLSCYAQINTDR